MLHASPLVIVLITALYIIFAIQLFWQLRGKQLDLKRATPIIALVVVFVICAIAGYLSSLFPQEWWVFREAIHWFLVVASVWLVGSNQAGIVAEMLVKHD